MLPRRYALCSLVALAVFIIACSNASKSPAPTAPTLGSASSSGTSIDLNTVTVPGNDGVRAGAIGTKNADGSINAVRVKIAPALPPPTLVEGTVSGLGGTCPALTFTLSGTTVHTTDKTRFEGGTCADIKAGARVGAMGPKASDGSVDARVVKIAPAK